MFDIQIENGGVWVTEQCLRLFYHGAVTLKENYSVANLQKHYSRLFSVCHNLYMQNNMEIQFLIPTNQFITFIHFSLKLNN